MKHLLPVVALLVAIGTPAATVPIAAARPDARRPGPKLPVQFVENAGQWDEAIRFRADRAGQSVWLHDDGWMMRLAGGDRRAAALRMTFEGASPAHLETGMPMPLVRNYHLGTRHATGVRAYDRVTISSLYPGIDVVMREAGDRFEYDLLVAPGADPEQIAVRCDGAESMEIDGDGALVIVTPVGTLRQPAPATWQVKSDGTREAVACRFRQIDAIRFGFDAEWSRDLPLTIDPGLVWSTVLSGNGNNEWTYGVATDAQGGVVVGGTTDASDYPVTAGVVQPVFGGPAADGYVARLSSSGAIAMLTYLGGSTEDGVRDVDLTPSGEIVVTGFTLSSNFPVTAGAFDGTYNGGGDIFVTHLNASGSALVYSTFLGGSGMEMQPKLTLIGGEYIVTGSTASSDFPTQNPLNPNPVGGWDAFVTRFAAGAGTLSWSTYVGGSFDDHPTAVSPSLNGGVCIAGYTTSTDFPVTSGASQAFNAGFADGFVLYINAGGTQIAYGTYFGGSGDDRLLAGDDRGLYFSGWTNSPNLPVTAGAFDTSFNGLTDAFAAFLIPGLVAAATYVGGSDLDSSIGIARTDAGITIVGSTKSANFPLTPGAWDSTLAFEDAVVVRLDSGLAQLRYSTLLGGSNFDFALGLACGPDGSATASGATSSTDYPGRTNPNSYGDAFITRLDMLPAGVSRYGAPSGTSATNFMDVTRMPQSGDPAFSVRCWGAPSSANGLLVVGVAPDVTGTPVMGVVSHINLAAPTVWVPVTADTSGAATVPFSLQGVPANSTFYVQFVWTDGAGLRASNALAIVVQ